MIKIAICDDSDYLRKIERDMLVSYSMKKNLDYSIDEYENGESLIDSAKNYDLIFMDYQFEDKGADGLTIARKIRENNDNVAIIFLTSYTGIVYDTFEVGAFRFLVKPIEIEKFEKAMDDYLLLQNSNKTIELKSERTNYYIKENSILFIEASGKLSNIHLAHADNDFLECNNSITEIESKLSQKSFFRVHKSYIVNFKYIASYNRTEITLTNKQKVFISRSRYKSFIETYANYLIEQGCM